jgi:hypothetical protein
MPLFAILCVVLRAGYSLRRERVEAWANDVSRDKIRWPGNTRVGIFESLLGAREYKFRLGRIGVAE